MLSRRLDPRAGVALVWGRSSAGGAANAIPQGGRARGHAALPRPAAWSAAGALVPSVVHEVVAPYGVRAEVLHTRGVPPVVNEPAGGRRAGGAGASLGEPGGAACATEQSLGGEDFSWYLQKVPGAMARLGTRTPGGPALTTCTRATFVVDERRHPVGDGVLAASYCADCPPPDVRCRR